MVRKIIPKNSVGPALVALVSDPDDGTTSNTNSAGKDTLHKAYSHRLLYGCSCSEQCTGQGAAQ